MSASEHVQSPLLGAQRHTAAPRSFVRPVLRLLVGAVFIFAGVSKAWAPLAFATDIEHFHLISWTIGMGAAFYLPWLEIFCGVALITGWLRSGALAILNGLMLAFLIATISAKARGINLDCGCFGSASKGLGFSAHLLIDLALLAALVALSTKEGHGFGTR